MKKRLKLKNNNIYSNIIIKSNYINRYLENTSKINGKFYFIVDVNVKYLVENFINKKNFNFFFVKSNEKVKTIDSYYKLSEKLLSKKIDRSSTIITIGGGTLGDLSGFIASTLLRGVEFILIPTTLLSQVDSSIGGKNGINSSYGKNLIGTFKHPKEVIIDTKALKTLPIRELKSGYAEILKHSLIKDEFFFNWLNKNYKKIFDLDDSVIRKAISKSLLIKLWYVKKDSNEKLTNNKSRAMLNFGHTFGHSLETFYKYRNKLNHGEAISIGMVIEAKISNKLGFLSDINLNKILDHFKKTKLKINDKNIKSKKIMEILKSDKKNLDNQINIVLLKKIGVSFFARNIKIDRIKEVIENL